MFTLEGERHAAIRPGFPTKRRTSTHPKRNHSSLRLATNQVPQNPAHHLRTSKIRNSSHLDWKGRRFIIHRNSGTLTRFLNRERERTPDLSPEIAKKKPQTWEQMQFYQAVKLHQRNDPWEEYLEREKRMALVQPNSQNNNAVTDKTAFFRISRQKLKNGYPVSGNPSPNSYKCRCLGSLPPRRLRS